MRSLLSILLSVALYPAVAQYNMLSLKTGLATFNMSHQKTLQGDFKTQSGLPLKVVHKFPPYFTFGGSLTIKLSERAATGFFLDYLSTGGRLHYEDYSGSAVIDQVLKCYQPGVFLQKQVNKSEGWPLFYMSHLFVAFTRESLRSAIVVGTDSDADSFSVKSTNLGFRPGLMLQHKMGSFVLQSSLGYEFHLVGRLNTDDGVALQNYDGDNVTAQWGGLRLGLGVGVVLESKK
jgi:hypothetical protein